MSGVYCCNATESFDCHPSASKPPLCANGTSECSVKLGGGCCPSDTQCSPNGCIEFDGIDEPSPITSTIVTLLTTTMAATLSRYTQTQTPISVETDSLQSVQVITTTVTMVIGGVTTPTATVLKEGEVAQKAEGYLASKLQWNGMYEKCASPIALVLLALMMALL